MNQLKERKPRSKQARLSKVDLLGGEIVGNSSSKEIQAQPEHRSSSLPTVQVETVPQIASLTQIVKGYQDREAWDSDLLARKGLSKGSRLCGLALSRHLNFKTGALFPSYRRLALCTGQSEQAVINQIATLEAEGRIEVIRTKGRVSNRYLLHMPAVSDSGARSGRFGIVTNPRESKRGEEATFNRRRNIPQNSNGQPSFEVGSNLDNLENLGMRLSDGTQSRLSPSWEMVVDQISEIAGCEEFETWLGEGSATLRPGEPAIIAVRNPTFVCPIRARFRLAFDEVFGPGKWDVR